LPSSNTTDCPVGAVSPPPDALWWAPLPQSIRAVVHPLVNQLLVGRYLWANVGTPAMFPHESVALAARRLLLAWRRCSVLPVSTAVDRHPIRSMSTRRKGFR
jgi:hypothetical protein